MIVKRIYFPGNTYIQNRLDFDNILSKHGLVWTKSAFKIYTNKDKKQLSSRIYNTSDNVHKFLAVHDVSDNSATFFYKTIGTGGNFLIDLNSFCASIGCVIDTKNGDYLNKIILRLNDYGDINISEDGDIKKEKGKDNKSLNDFKLGTFDINVRRLARRQLMKYIIAYGESLRRRGISIKIALYFKRKDIHNSVRWALESQLLRPKGRSLHLRMQRKS